MHFCLVRMDGWNKDESQKWMCRSIPLFSLPVKNAPHVWGREKDFQALGEFVPSPSGRLSAQDTVIKSTAWQAHWCWWSSWNWTNDENTWTKFEMGLKMVERTKWWKSSGWKSRHHSIRLFFCMMWQCFYFTSWSNQERKVGNIGVCCSRGPCYPSRLGLQFENCHHEDMSTLQRSLWSKWNWYFKPETSHCSGKGEHETISTGLLSGLSPKNWTIHFSLLRKQFVFVRERKITGPGKAKIVLEAASDRCAGCLMNH